MDFEMEALREEAARLQDTLVAIIQSQPPTVRKRMVEIVRQQIHSHVEMRERRQRTRIYGKWGSGVGVVVLGAMSYMWISFDNDFFPATAFLAACVTFFCLVLWLGV